MTTTTRPTVTASLAAVVSEAERAEADLRAAQAAAEQARAKAATAQEAAKRERAAANARYLQVLESEHPEARRQALAAAAEAGEAFARAARGEDPGADLVGTWRTWLLARVEVWRIETALAAQREQHGRPTRFAAEPRHQFAHDLSEVLDRYSMEVQDAATETNRSRKAAFLSGKAPQ